jgi:hypothetical protein
MDWSPNQLNKIGNIHTLDTTLPITFLARVIPLLWNISRLRQRVIAPPNPQPNS